MHRGRLREKSNSCIWFEHEHERQANQCIDLAICVLQTKSSKQKQTCSMKQTTVMRLLHPSTRFEQSTRHTRLDDRMHFNCNFYYVIFARTHTEFRQWLFRFFSMSYKNGFKIDTWICWIKFDSFFFLLVRRLLNYMSISILMHIEQFPHKHRFIYIWQMEKNVKLLTNSLRRLFDAWLHERGRLWHLLM